MATIAQYATYYKKKFFYARYIAKLHLSGGTVVELETFELSWKKDNGGKFTSLTWDKCDGGMFSIDLDQVQAIIVNRK
jgi:hypothetical protein